MNTPQIRILHIEDDEDDHLILKRVLHTIYPNGLHLVWASTFKQGLALAEAESFDLYLVDFFLGGEDGVDWFLALKQQHLHLMPPAILLTGIGGSNEDHRAANSGFADFIEKSEINPRLLERAIRYAILNHKILKELADSRDNYLRLFEDSFDTIIIIDQTGAVSDCNPATQELTGYTRTEMNAISLQNLFTPQSSSVLLEYMNSLLTDESAKNHHYIETQLINRSGIEVSVNLSLHLIHNGSKARFAVTLHNITEQKLRENRLEELASHDVLTGIHNRRFFDARLQTEWERSERHGHQLSLLIIDIDLFKHVNDKFGHTAGDAVLKMIAQTVSGLLRSIDVLARWGGEEFIVLLAETDLRGAMIVGEKIREEISNSSTVFDGQTLAVTASIGIASRQNPDEITALIQRADKALYVAKQTGRNKVVGQ